MRVAWSTNQKSLHVHIDSDSTHNFLNLQTAKHLGRKLENSQPLWVAIAEGQKILSQYIGWGFTWTMQGVQFTIDIVLLHLRGLPPNSVKMVSTKKLNKTLQNPEQISYQCG